jgi:hypothetical protein
MPVIEETSGLMYWVFAAILNQIHQVPDDLANKAQQAFYYWMTALHLADSLYDFPDDYTEGTENIIAAALIDHPNEERKLQEYIKGGGRLDNTWVRRNSPNTYSDIVQLYRKYHSLLIAVDEKNETIRWMGIGADSAFHMATANPLVPKLMLAFIHLQAQFRARFHG